MIGSIMKCGLPRACTSPAARVSVVGTPINLMPCEACTRPGLPTSIFGLRAFCKSGGSQPISSSAPPSIKTSAVRSCTTKLGRASTKCESSVGFAKTVTCTLSPPISRASEPKSGNVATTLSLASAEKAHAKVVESTKRICFMSLKFMRSMCAENEFELKKNRIDFALREEKVFFEKVVIVLQSEFRKFGWIPGEIRANPQAGLSFVVVGKLGIGHVQVVAANTCDPTFFEPPQH